HPVEKYFNKPYSADHSSRNFNKILVLLIDFPEDTDAQSTGNGKFMQEVGDYPMTIGRPPHDYNYFVTQMEALRYYYLAVSYGSFDADYDVFPQSETGNFSAYTLPNQMRYYNPPGANDVQMISRFEEYFQDIFTTADQDDAIDFSQYEHFIVIHAGSDYQHDVNGDTPVDIPSFFITVGTNKEVTVDNGIVINHACNVPETITQDISFDPNESPTYFYDYGVINAVLVHEFGHSLGFVDLYNTYNNTPQVGYYDIMDSGGSTGIVYQWNADSLYVVEGVFPALPGAWTRQLAFEDDFRARGILKDISEFDLSRPITVLPSSLIYDAAALTDTSAYFIKVPLNETEYLLIENRQVDPDGDGGASVIGSNDGRIILCPSYLNSNVGPNYEYDYILPGFMDADYNSYGGGLLVWHIDNSILEENNNFANNSVNTDYYNRAVKIVEADNIDDIGNPYSLYWYGTEYDPFYKYMPIIDEEGYFTGWDDETILNTNGELEFIGEIFSDELSSTSAPALFTNTGDPSIFSLMNISSYSIEYNEERSMSFHFGIQSFDVTEKIAEFDSLADIGFVGGMMSFPTFPVLADDQITFYSLLQDNWANDFGISLPFTGAADFPILYCDYNNNGQNCFEAVQDNSVFSISLNSIDETSYDNNLSDAPMLIKDWTFPTLVIPTADSLYFYYNNQTSSLPIGKAILAFDGNYLIAASKGMIDFCNDPAVNNSIKYQVKIADYEPVYRPVSYVDSQNNDYNATFVQDQKGN
ncbi:MAG TPA: hypothetical protein PLD62_10785, partial [Candidatus Cloacimonadota bacterium]|nr:hypothetical protein [Candidatus Cloacimonadota bacterium]